MDKNGGVGTNSDNISKYHISRGCQQWLPKLFFKLNNFISTNRSRSYLWGQTIFDWPTACKVDISSPLLHHILLGIFRKHFRQESESFSSRIKAFLSCLISFLHNLYFNIFFAKRLFQRFTNKLLWYIPRMVVDKSISAGLNMG